MRLPHVFVVVPILNEEANLPRFLHDLGSLARASEAMGRKLRLLAIDDGSSDRSTAVLESATPGFDVVVLRHDHNRGPGAAFATAFAYLAESLAEPDLVFTIEGDNTSRVDTALQMLTRLGEGYDVVLASPYAYGGGIENTSILRTLLSHGANGFMRGMVGVHGIHTMSSFFRLYRSSAIQRLQHIFGPGILERTGFEAMVELLMKMVILKMRISEVEMRLDTSLRIGRSKMKILRTVRGYLALFALRTRWEQAARAAGDTSPRS
jgi:dolichol-phosphate mannosyltransferase